MTKNSNNKHGAWSVSSVAVHLYQVDYETLWTNSKYNFNHDSAKQHDSIPMYLCLQRESSQIEASYEASHRDRCHQELLKIAESISPSVMILNSFPESLEKGSGTESALIDLSLTFEYWMGQVRQSACRFQDLLRSLLPADVYVCSGLHPWQALLMAQYESRRECNRGHNRSQRSWVDSSSPAGRRDIESMSVDDWIVAAQSYAMFLSRKESVKFQKEIRKLQDISNKMYFSRISQLKEVPLSQIERRFGKVISKLLMWTFSEHFLGREESGFPWESVKSQTIPEVHTVLMYPLRSWENIESLLRDDLDRICKLPCWSFEDRVISLEWVLSFSHTPVLVLPIVFRQPHHLHRETSHHKTALLQAFYSWQKGMKSKKKSSLEVEYDEEVTGWTLIIKERFKPQPKQRLIFDDEEEFNVQLDRLSQLENLIDIPLKSYVPSFNWTWTTHQLLDSQIEFHSHSNKNVVKDLAPTLAKIFITRPLWVSTCLDHKANNKTHLSFKDLRVSFQERIMNKWWLSPSSQTSQASSEAYFYQVLREKLPLGPSSIVKARANLPVSDVCNTDVSKTAVHWVRGDHVLCGVIG